MVVRWLVWKQHFFAIFDLIWTHILALKDPKMNCLNSILVKKDTNYIITNYVTLRLTSWSEIIESRQFFAIFD